MRVSELIKELQKQDPDVFVTVWDPMNDCEDQRVSVTNEGEHVLIATP